MSVGAAERNTRAKSDRTVVLNDLTVIRGYEQLLQTQGLDSLDALFHVVDVDTLNKPGLAAGRKRLRLTIQDGTCSRTFYLKRYQAPRGYSSRGQAPGSRARSHAGREWAAILRLADLGIACADPVAFGEEIARGREVRSAILLAQAPGDSLERWCLRWGVVDRDLIRSLIKPLADMVAQLHRGGYAHRDLYLSHIFFDPRALKEGKQTLRLIDLQRLTPLGLFRTRRIVKDLAALNYSAPGSLVSRADRLRWLKAYAGVERLDGFTRRLWYRVIAKTRQIASHDKRRSARWAMGA